MQWSGTTLRINTTMRCHAGRKDGIVSTLHQDDLIKVKYAQVCVEAKKEPLLPEKKDNGLDNHPQCTNRVCIIRPLTRVLMSPQGQR